MAKQRRAKTRPGTPKAVKRAAKIPASTSKKSVKRQKRPAPQSVREAPVRRTSYVEAVARYEQGFEALQRRQYGRAADLLRSVLTEYPEEKELHERVRLYLNICERQAAPREANPRTVEERVYAATLALNAGRYDAAVDHLRAVLSEQPGHDHAEYMLAVIATARGRPADALGHLQRALEFNPDNRALALHDPDLEPLRDNEGFRAVIDAAPAPRTDRRKPSKFRGSR